jgi:hypothetical protein
MKSKPRRTARAMRKLTLSEKEARGTRQRAYDPKVRDPEAIRADIEWTNETLESLKLTAREAAMAIRKLGVVIPTGRGAQDATKPNPAIRIQSWALTTARSLKRELVFLREEEALALAAQKPVDDEFAGLD